MIVSHDIMHHSVIGQLIDCLHQREFVNKTLICSIICVILSKCNAVMSYYEVIIGYYEVIMGYFRLLWVIPGYYGVLSYRENLVKIYCIDQKLDHFSI